MTDLIERLEQAEGPSYALDCAIWDHIYPGERQARFDKLTAKGQPYHMRLGPADMDGYVKPLRSFTASIDAALTLVPDGSLWSAETWDTNGVYPAHVRASVWVQGGPRCYAATPALALCIAALRAREADRD